MQTRGLGSLRERRQHAPDPGRAAAVPPLGHTRTQICVSQARSPAAPRVTPDCQWIARYSLRVYHVRDVRVDHTEKGGASHVA